MHPFASVSVYVVSIIERLPKRSVVTAEDGLSAKLTEVACPPFLYNPVCKGRI